MRNRRVLVGLLLAVLLAAVSFGRADAQGGYGGTDGCAASTCPFISGQTLIQRQGEIKTITIDLGGFGPLTLVVVTLRSEPVVLGTFTADAQGRVRATVTLPGDVTVGNHSLTVAGTDAAGRPYAVTSPVVVAAAITTTTRTATINTPTTRTISGNVESNGLLARTGRTLGPVAAVGALLVVGGGVLTVVARRRQRES